VALLAPDAELFVPRHAPRTVGRGLIRAARVGLGDLEDVPEVAGPR
jgi:hypothetical protein